MRKGAIFPITEIGTDPIAIRDYAQAIEAMGYDHIVVFDHVLGANAAHHKLWGPYTHEFQFHEPFVLLGYLAAITKKLELATGIVSVSHVESQGAFVDSIDGVVNGVEGHYWSYYINDEYGLVSADTAELEDGDVVRWVYMGNPFG